MNTKTGNEETSQIKDTVINLIISREGKIGHGNFQRWYESELGWSHTTILNFMNIAERFGQNANYLQFDHNTLYFLANKSTPEQAQQEARKF